LDWGERITFGYPFGTGFRAILGSYGARRRSTEKTAGGQLEQLLFVPFPSQSLPAPNQDHIVASGSLPSSFAMTVIDGKSYWEGGLFDNTPLGAVLERLDVGFRRSRMPSWPRATCWCSSIW
jgi:hypothetical protein